MGNHGTADGKRVWRPGQFVEAQIPFLRALHKALEDISTDPAIIIERLNKGGKLLTEGLKQIIGKVVSVCNWPIWKTIEIGTGLKTADDFRNALTRDGCKIGFWANDILGQVAFRAVSEKVKVNLCVASTREITGKDTATTAEVFAGIYNLGGELCPGEVGPQLRLQYEYQLKGQRLFIAMEPISGWEKNLCVFSVDCSSDNGELWLSDGNGHPAHLYCIDTLWVFVRPE